MHIPETTRLIIRRFITDDADALMGIFGDAEVMRYSMTGVVDAAWVATFIERCNRNYRERGYGLWAAVAKQSNEVIGYCGLSFFPNIDGEQEVEIGYRLVRSHWGRGYATEAATAVRDFAIDTLGMNRLIALVDPANTASIRVAEKIGMRYEKDVLLDGFQYADRVYALECRP